MWILLWYANVAVLFSSAITRCAISKQKCWTHRLFQKSFAHSLYLGWALGFFVFLNFWARLVASLLNTVFNKVEVEPVLQEMTGVVPTTDTNKAPFARPDNHDSGFWERKQPAVFNVRVCHPNVESYKDLTPKKIYRQQENEKKREHASRVLEVEQTTFSLLVFTTTGGMADECKRFHIRLAKDFEKVHSLSWGQLSYVPECHAPQEELP